MTKKGFIHLNFSKENFGGFTRQNFAKQNLAGFTLVELLVVISIIGTLASIVMVSMSGATDKARDARIKQGISQLRTIAELMKDDDNSYANLCSDTSTISGDDNYATQQSIIQTDVIGQGGVIKWCYNNSNSYCLSVQLVGDTSKYYCIDSSGLANSTGTPCGSADIGCNGHSI